MIYIVAAATLVATPGVRTEGNDVIMGGLGSDTIDGNTLLHGHRGADAADIERLVLLTGPLCIVLAERHGKCGPRTLADLARCDDP